MKKDYYNSLKRALERMPEEEKQEFGEGGLYGLNSMYWFKQSMSDKERINEKDIQQHISNWEKKND